MAEREKGAGDVIRPIGEQIACQGTAFRYIDAAPSGERDIHTTYARGAIFAIAVFNTHSFAAGVTLTPNTIALTGTDGPLGPNLGSGVTFSSLSTASVNRRGEFSLTGGSNNGNITKGIWTGQGEDRSGTFRVNVPVPDGSGTFFSTIDTVSRINEDGEVYFQAIIVGGSVPQYDNTRAYFRATANHATVLARVLGSNGSYTPDPLIFNPAPQELFLTNNHDLVTWYGHHYNTNAWGVWIADPASPRAAAVVGDPAPGTPPGIRFAESMFPVAVNRTGSELIKTGLQNAAGQSQGNAFYVVDSTSTRLLARSTDQAPGQPMGTLIGTIGGVGAINDSGDSVILTGSGIYAGTPGNLRLVATTGAAAPGLSGVTFSSLSSVGAAGPASVFTANLSGAGVTSTNSTSVWIDRGTGPTMILRSGQSAPGLPGLFLESVGFGLGNELGQFIVDKTLSGSGVTSTNRRYLGVWDPGAGLLIAARTGDTLMCGDGVERTIQGFISTTLETLDVGAKIPGSNALWTGGGPVGLLVYDATFTDGRTGAFSIIVPSPSGWMTLCSSATGGLLIRRRRRGR